MGSGDRFCGGAGVLPAELNFLLKERAPVLKTPGNWSPQLLEQAATAAAGLPTAKEEELLPEAAAEGGDLKGILVRMGDAAGDAGMPGRAL